ncbi:hypothetical protein [Haliovirga abyssi]|uniref:Uncharacterized protein n=1 Tax=Haliovirga abyssi TaxID=2996794 RepID=A0AAU9DI63_9FUSO|nr:hypothetical protein [Haliovirga abyssi]BDU50444.1 hypothetical protein HLVA_10130 [Haliovirga abyssi]
MEFFRQLIIKILESSILGEKEKKILKLLKDGQDLNFKEKQELEEIIDNMI